jgi:hypothetical protein
VGDAEMKYLAVSLIGFLMFLGAIAVIPFNYYPEFTMLIWGLFFLFFFNLLIAIFQDLGQ